MHTHTHTHTHKTHTKYTRVCVCRNLNYWDSVSTLAGEVRNPGKNFPRALLIAVILVVAMYLVPTMAALGVSSSADPAAGWGMGYYCQVAEQVGCTCKVCLSSQEIIEC